MIDHKDINPKKFALKYLWPSAAKVRTVLVETTIITLILVTLLGFCAVTGAYSLAEKTAPYIYITDTYNRFWPTPVVPEEVLVSPDVQLLARYMKSRNSQLAAEITQLMATFIVEGAAANGLPLPLVIGIVEAESMFNPMANARIPDGSGDYARGLMQVYQGEGVEVDKDQAYDLGYNITMGCQILNKKIELNKGNVENALRNYSGNTEGYSDKVLANIGRFILFKTSTTAAIVEVEISMN